ncbi:hypothetical protein J7F03_36090 [Streptomyces sp. ISL-43]|uniref:hypothetical protein n=1 Tax=Streptomyces sp. ISL-43 TaxID=2819183 RepID=UPI001BEC4ACD|nr:hypothetical protein [Streptomyces sp. ISL-43]MBT2452383.1 hypothetical protein [Streptomyces sp. ISL-43]
MNPTQDTPTEAGSPGAAHSALSLALGLLAVAISLIAVAMSLEDDLGAGATAALIGADVVLIAVMGALFATLRPQPARGGSPAGPAQRVHDEELLDALEPLGASRGPGGEGR